MQPAIACWHCMSLQCLATSALALFVLGVFLLNAHIGHLHEQEELWSQNRLIHPVRLPLQTADLPATSINNTPIHGKNARLLLTVMACGRLGNQMFQYASLLGIARKNKRTPFVASNLEIVRYFTDIHVDDRLVHHWKAVTEDQYAVRDPRMDYLPPVDVKIHGFLQSWRYFANVTREVRRAFSFKRSIRKQQRIFFGMHVSPSTVHNFTSGMPRVTKIGVHVRRADMLEPFNRERGYNSAPLSYLQKAFRYMRSKFGDESMFFVVSDDLEWCRKYLVGTNVRIVEAAAPIVHLGLLAMCDHVIMTVGTFGWWGAFLSGGHVVYYDGYPRQGSEMAHGFHRGDFFFPQWVPIGA